MDQVKVDWLAITPEGREARRARGHGHIEQYTFEAELIHDDRRDTEKTYYGLAVTVSRAGVPLGGAGFWSLEVTDRGFTLWADNCLASQTPPPSPTLDMVNAKVDEVVREALKEARAQLLALIHEVEENQL